MLEDLIKKIERVIGLVPYRYWNALAGAVIVLLAIGVGNTLMSPPELPETAIAKKEEQNASLELLIKKEKPKSVLASIRGGNLFRSQRKDSEKRPPPPPAKPAPKPKPIPKPAKPVIEPEITLRGTIITETERIAIIDAKVEKFERKEIPSRLVISGAYQGKRIKKWPDGKYYTVKSAGKESFKKRTFREGESYSTLVMERIFEDRIEVKNLSTGKTVLIYLKNEKPKKRMEPAKAVGGAKMTGGTKMISGAKSAPKRGGASSGRSALSGGSANKSEKKPAKYISGAKTK